MNKTTSLCRYKDKQTKSKRKSWSKRTNREVALNVISWSLEEIGYEKRRTLKEKKKVVLKVLLEETKVFVRSSLTGAILCILLKNWEHMFYLSGKLPTYPSPKPTLTLTSHLGQNVGSGKG